MLSGCPRQASSIGVSRFPVVRTKRRPSMRTVSIVLALLMSLAIAGTLTAAEPKKGPAGKGPATPATAFLAALEKLNLTAEQKAKVEELTKQYVPKLAELTKKREAILTDEQKKARQEVQKAARDAGKSEQEALAAGRTAIKLTDEQQTKMAEMQKEMAAIMLELRQKATALLTPEQREQLQKQQPKAAGAEGKKGGKPPAK